MFELAHGLEATSMKPKTFIFLSGLYYDTAIIPAILFSLKRFLYIYTNTYDDYKFTTLHIRLPKLTAIVYRSEETQGLMVAEINTRPVSVFC